MKPVMIKHGVIFVQYVFAIVTSHLVIKYFFHIPEIIEFSPMYVLVLFAVFCVWAFGVYKDVCKDAAGMRSKARGEE